MPANVFEAIRESGHDEDFLPVVTEEFIPTDVPAGSKTKVQVLADRVRKGMPLWHPKDKSDFADVDPVQAAQARRRR